MNREYSPTLEYHNQALRVNAYTSPGLIVNEYHSLAKYLTDGYTAETKLVPFADALQTHGQHRHQLLAGWMYAESALVMHNRSTEDRELLLQASGECWQRAHQSLVERDERKLLYDRDTPGIKTLHCQLNLATLDMLRAIVRGDVTKESRQHLYDGILRTAVQTDIARNNLLALNDHSPYETPYLGFLHELNAMLLINRLQSTSAIALPALPRADCGNGEYNMLTHDIQVLNTRWGEIRHVLPIEVKATPQEHHYQRYTAAIVGGTVHLHPEKQRDPSYLTSLLVKESLGVADEADIALLDDATNKVIHAIRHGYNGTTQCRDVEQCELYGLERNTHHKAAK